MKDTRFDVVDPRKHSEGSGVHEAERGRTLRRWCYALESVLPKWRKGPEWLKEPEVPKSPGSPKSKWLKAGTGRRGRRVGNRVRRESRNRLRLGSGVDSQTGD